MRVVGESSERKRKKKKNGREGKGKKLKQTIEKNASKTIQEGVFRPQKAGYYQL